LETIYLVIVVLLFILAASDLVVGVSNDAVNFLNSAIGSKVASYKVIMIIAAMGILVGAVFSGGMMEVARKGIFNPGEFYFSEIMIIFLAVMVTDIVLLDTYNTFGLPTSTTVSIVFELLGAAVAMASIKLIFIDGGQTIAQFINSSKALAIISGILLSVAVAFTAGAIIQYLIRIVFSFKFVRRVKYIGALWGGIAFTAMTYFILIKGAKGATFMTTEMLEWIGAHTGLIIIYSLIGWTVLLQILYSLFNVNILKMIVLVGTFSLAMAFAGNDLVNFIGVPIAGYNAYELFAAADAASADTFLMNGLSGKVPTPTLFLLISGMIMVVTLYMSKKARTVTQTELSLARQEEGDERFSSSWLSRALVRVSVNSTQIFNKILPDKVIKAIEKQFEPNDEVEKGKDAPMFDLVRASVNLTVASILISFATSLKLPLSTTYVTFMVAMGTSLSDKAWDRESAVYRVTGVLAVIGGWFLTALSAFVVAFIMVYIFHFGGAVGIFIMVAVVIYILFRTHVLHKKSKESNTEKTQEVHSVTDENIAEKTNKTIVQNIKKISVELKRIINGLEKEDIKELKRAKKEIQKITAKTKYLKDHINVIIDKLKVEALDSAYYFVTTLDYMREMIHSISFIANPVLDHVDNNHKPFTETQIRDLRSLETILNKMIDLVVKSLESQNFSKQGELLKLQEELINLIKIVNKNQIKRIKDATTGSRRSILFLSIVNEIKNLSLQLVNLFKSQRDFLNYKNGSKT
jgi:phosphate/sulfate permease